MSYAAFADVVARAGRFAGAFQVDGKHPDETDVELVLADVSAEIDAAMRGHGFDPAAVSASVSAALKDMTAYGALARLLPAAVPGGEADPVAKMADVLFTDGISGIVAGTLPALAELYAGLGGEAKPAPAGDFWTDAGYDGEAVPPMVPVTPWDRSGRRSRYTFIDRNLGPKFVKGQTL